MSKTNVIFSALELGLKLYNIDEGKIKFTKKDGTVRLMKCTLNFKRIPKNHQPKRLNSSQVLERMQKDGIINVFDLEKQDWRSIKFENVDWLEVSQKRYKIQPFLGKKE